MNKNKTSSSLFVLLFITLSQCSLLIAAEPVLLRDSFAGNYNFAVTGGSFRNNPNSIDPCSLNLNAGGNPISDGVLSVPATANVIAAYLYWGASADIGGSADTRVRFGRTGVGGRVRVDASDSYIHDFDASRRFYSAKADVTTVVQSYGSPSGNYRVSGMNISTITEHCSIQTVMGNWALVVIYEDPSERFNVVNVFDGFDPYQNSSLVLTPDNFQVDSPPEGKIVHITFEGDDSLLGGGESLRLNGTELTDASNPAGEQFNSFSNVVNQATYGLDIDVYDISNFLTAGDTVATTYYGSGQDLVFLIGEIITVSNTPVADLQLDVTGPGNWVRNSINQVSYTLTNNGPQTATQPIQLQIQFSDTSLFTLNNAIGSGWSCTATPTGADCIYNDQLLVGSSAPVLILNLDVGNLSNNTDYSVTGVVSGNEFDNWQANNTAIFTAQRQNGPPTLNPVITISKEISLLSDPVNNAFNPKGIPGAEAEYRIEAINSGLGTADNDSMVIVDALPSNFGIYIRDIAGAGSGPVQFVDGTDSSNLTYSFLAANNLSDDIDFSNDGGLSWSYNPLSDIDADGYNFVVTHIRVRPKGTFAASDGSSTFPSFAIRFRGKLN